MSSCYSTGLATGGSSTTGASIGYINGGSTSNISRCYFDSEVMSGSGIGNVSSVGTAVVQGLTGAGMTYKSMFVGWDFNTVWGIVEAKTRPFLKFNGVVAGEENVCAGATKTYEDDASQLDYTWTVTGGTIVLGQGSGSIMVQWDNITTTGTVRVEHSNGTRAGLDVNVVRVRPSIAGNMRPYAGQTATYATESGMSSYQWSVAGGEIVSGAGTSEVEVRWRCTVAQGKISVTYTGSGGCTAGSGADSAVAIRQTYPSISGNMKPATGEMCTYETENGMSGYTWTLSGGAILMGQGTRFLSVRWDSVAVNTAGSLSVYYTTENACVTAPTDSATTITTTKDATLSSLSLSEGTLSPAFDAGITEYAASVPYLTGSLTISATANDADAYLSGAGAKTLSVGKNTFEVVATAKDGVTTKTYTVVVTRIPLSADATLQSLTVSPGILSPAFSADVTYYTASVYNSVESIALVAVAADTGAKVSGAGTKALSVGANALGVEVTAENGGKQTYTVVVNRAGSPSEERVNSLIADTLRLYNLATTLQGQVSATQAENSDLKSDTLRLHAAAAALQAQLAAASGAIGDLERDTLRLYDAAAALQAQLAAASGAIGDLERDTLRLHDAAAALQAQLAAASGAISDLERDTLRLHDAAAALQAQLAAASGAIGDLERDTLRLHDAAAALQAQLAAASGAIGDLERDTLRLHDAAAALQLQLAAANGAIGDLQAQLAGCLANDSTIAQLEEELAAANSAIGDLQAQLAAANSTISDLQAQLAAKPTAVAGTSAASQALQVYPNPANNHLTVTNDQWAANNGKLLIYNLQEEVVAAFTQTGAQTTVDISALPTGMYIMKAGGKTAKIVKK
ncbi:MAG: cadherin-like beta sandwich domain-containing protein [Prevotellaceae bacterium]|nr:cadherin-like beta sandwich domain-containing protein [Prevotellaceae bacterium]